MMWKMKATFLVFAVTFSISQVFSQLPDLNECGVSRGCFRKPDGCDPVSSCQSFVTYMFNSTSQMIEFHLGGSPDWVALGQNIEGQGETLMGMLRGQYCVRDPNGGPPVLGSFERNSASGNGQPNFSGRDVVSNVTILDTSIQEGRISCRYARPVTVNADNIYLYNMDIILIGVLSDGTVQNDINPNPHALGNYISAAINFTFLGNAVPQGIPLTPRVKAHGILMIISWMLFATFGIFMARYMKTALKEKKICGKAAWFPIHQMTMLLCVTTFVAGLILILVELEGRWADQAGTHHWLGLFTVIAGLIQPVMAAIRPDPKADKRFIFNWMHRSVGFLAWVLGAVAIIYGLYITVEEYVPALAFVIAVPAMGLILDIVIFIEDYIGSGSKADAAVTYEGSRQEVQGVQKSDSKEKGSAFRWLFLVLIVALAIAVTVYHVHAVANGVRPA